MRSAVQDAIEEITSVILNESPFGDVEARSIAVLEDTGPEAEPYLHVIVSASDPDPRVGTWSREAVFHLRSRVSELAAQSDVDLPPIVVDVHPEGPDEEEGTDDEQSSDLAKGLDDTES